MDLEAALGAGAGVMKRSGLNVFLKIARVSNLPTVWANCIAGWVLGGGMDTVGYALREII